MKNKNKLDQNIKTNLEHFMKSENLEEINSLVEQNPDALDDGTYHLMHFAAWDGTTAVIEELAKHENIRGLINTPAISVGTDIHPVGTPIMEAISVKRPLEVIKCLVNLGADINLVNGRENCTPLHYALRNYRTDVIEYLISKKAKVTIKDISGKNALDLAKEYLLKDDQNLIDNIEQEYEAQIKLSGEDSTI